MLGRRHSPPHTTHNPLGLGFACPLAQKRQRECMVRLGKIKRGTGTGVLPALPFSVRSKEHEPVKGSSIGEDIERGLMSAHTVV
jgi:hypothetical protein